MKAPSVFSVSGCRAAVALSRCTVRPHAYTAAAQLSSSNSNNGVSVRTFSGTPSCTSYPSMYTEAAIVDSKRSSEGMCVVLASHTFFHRLSPPPVGTCKLGANCSAQRALSTSSPGTNAHAQTTNGAAASPPDSEEKPQGRQSRWRISRVLFVSVAAAAAMILIPPMEMLPHSLLQVRVTLDGIGRVLRCVEVGCGILLDYKLSLRGVAADDQEAWNVVHTRSALRLVKLAEQNGGLYIKAGQIFCSMSHILPPSYISAMSVLQDAVAKRPFQEIVAVIERDFNAPVEEVFASLDPAPIAAASLAQVHRGTLKKCKTDVAVKVQYIDIAKRFKGDMHTINLMLRIAGYLYPGYDLSEIIIKLTAEVAAELDFRIEARNCDRAGRDLKPLFGDRVVTPVVHWNHTTARVLTTTFVANAVKASDRAGMIRLGISPKTAAEWIYDAMAFEMFSTGFVHADPHAGNILVHKLPNGQPQVVLLDFGLCCDMSEEKRHMLARIWTASVTHDNATLQEVAASINCNDYALLASCFLQHPYEVFESSGPAETPEAREMMRKHVTEAMLEVNDVIQGLPREYPLILRNLIAVKAIGKELGEPVNRPLRMLRFSVRESHKNASFFALHRILWKARWEELKSALIMWYIRSFHAEEYKLMEEELGKITH